MPQLRDYQQRAIDQLYEWLRNNDGNPCIVMPTGSGKSHIIAQLCKDALQNWPETKILMLSHVKELIAQDASKLREHWPNAPLGIFSAGLRQRNLSEPITFAGIQSVRNRAEQIGHIDLIICDESHLISHKDQGGYRKLIDALTKINPALRVIGLTATPYRLGHGYITEKPAIFDDLIEPVSIEELVGRGFLSPLRSKVTELKINANGLHKRGGEYIPAELQKLVDDDRMTFAAVSEALKIGEGRKAMLFFCAGVAHAHSVRDALDAVGVVAECITGATPRAERDRILKDYKAGKIRALTNANVLTTGFDYPDIDMIVMLRPTLSPGLYVQMAGRGMRLKSQAKDCIVLDFAGVVARHGPITDITPPSKAGSSTSEAPTKTCPECQEIMHARKTVCPACGFVCEKPEQGQKETLQLHDDDIMGKAQRFIDVIDWQWSEYTSKASGKKLLLVRYYSKIMSDPVVMEYLTVLHGGYAGQKALRTILEIAAQAGVVEKLQNQKTESLIESADIMNRGEPPKKIFFKMDGKYHRVTSRIWQDAESEN